MAEPTTRTRRILKRLGVGVAAMAVTLVVLALLVVAVAETNWAKIRVLQLADRLADGDGLTVDFGAIAATDGGRIAITGLTVGDGGGVWLEIESAIFDWSPGALLSRRLELASLDVTGGHIRRWPAGGDDEPEGGLLPALPVDIVVQDIGIDSLRFDPPTGIDDALAAEGFVELGRDGQAWLRLEAASLDEPDTGGRLFVRLRRNDAIDLDVDLRTAPDSRWTASIGAIAGRAAELKVVGDGALTAWQGTVQAALGGASLAAFDVTIAGNRRRNISLSGQIVPATWQADLPAPLDRPLDLSAETELARNGTLTIDALTIANDDLQLAASGTVNTGSGDTAIALDASWRAPQLADGGASEPVDLNAELTRSGATGVIAVESFTVAHRALTGDGTAVLDPATERIEIDLEAQTDDLAAAARLFGADVGGDSATFVAAVSGTFSDLAIDLDARAPRLAVGDTVLSDVVLDLTATNLPDAAVIDGEARFEGPAGATRLVVATRDGGGDARTVTLTGSGPGLTLDGAATLSAGWSPERGRLDTTVSSLQPWSAFAGRALSGSAEAAVTFARRGDGWAIDGTARADALMVGLGDGSALVTDAVTLAAAPADDGRTALDIDAGPLRYGRLAVDAIRLDAVTDGITGDFTATLDSATPIIPDTEAAGRFASADALVVTLDRAQLIQDGATWRLTAPATLTQADNGTTIGPFTLAGDGGEIRLDAATAPDRIRANLRADGVPLRLFAAADSRLNADGRISGTVALDTARAGAIGTADLTLADYRPRLGGVELDPTRGSFALSLTRTRLDADVKLATDTASELTATVAVPVTVNGNAIAFPPDGRLSGRIAGEADLFPIWQALQADTQILRGMVSGNVTLGGTLGAPTLSGPVRLSDGSYRHIEFGTALDDIDVALDTSGRSFALRRARATDGGEGTVSADGQIALGGPGGFDGTVSVTLTDATLVRRDDLTATTNGELAFRRQDADSDFTGTLTINNLEYRLINALPANVVRLEVVEEGSVAASDDGATPSTADDTGPMDPTRLDLTVDIPNQAFVRGRGLDSEWSGNLRISGTTAEPRIDGTLSVVRGQFDFAGKTFALESGTVRFDGGRRIDPTLNLVARYDTDDFVARISITGKAEKPRIELSSTPALPEDEILARILFNSSVARLGPLEALQLADALRSLATGGGGQGIGGLIGATRSGLGLDVLRVGAGANGGTDPTVTGGKYISDRVYVEVETGAASADNSVRLEVDVTDDIAVNSEVSRQKGANVGVQWEWDY